ncbi:nuclear transport factor 2 family protein [Cryptosporangium aurantiacum]|uniref:SnoaL-like domain-containing protein n=1 Tax=Cryptosporangium aurantiacum TaxID=134849 RepID=A0A1M7RLV1_9ACTN|nr:nuclear transport factor 2 family protein [Cryptosporangium aurantiacum]SHN47305.1 SnoaL-like domain-containing protein [Cryptosporangium aurantiacum]
MSAEATGRAFGAATADGGSPARRPGGVERLLDRAEIADRIADLALGLDLLDVVRYRRCFADVVRVRNPHFRGGAEFRDVAGDEWAESVCATQARFTTRVHVLTNPSVAFVGTEADVVLTQQATFGVGEAFYRVAGPLRLGLARLPAWRITRLDFEVRVVEGDRALFERAWGADR